MCYIILFYIKNFDLSLHFIECEIKNILYVYVSKCLDVYLFKCPQHSKLHRVEFPCADCINPWKKIDRRI